MLVLNHKSKVEIGHSIYLRYDPPLHEVTTKSTTVYQDRMKRLQRDQLLKVNVTNKSTGKPMKVDFYLEKDQEGTVHREAFKTSMSYHLAAFSEYVLKIEMGGYLIYSNELRTQNETDNVNLELEFEPILDGGKFNLNKVRFRKNEATLLGSSTADLMSLKSFMDLNPLARIEIVGHVNAPDMENSMKIQRISRDRARAVYEFLIMQGVDKKRMTYLGKGNMEMIYPKPVSKDEKEANRRVEILILR